MKPVLQALILAERVYKTDDGRAIIAGTFNGVTLRDSDSTNDQEEISNHQKEHNGKKKIRGGQPGAPYAYISLTDVCGNTDLLLQFVNLTSNEVILEQMMTIPCDDRLATIEIVSALPILPIKEPGVYAFEVVCEGEIIGSHRIIAKISGSE